jgi:D-threo-aldose 1-dehydrogenase
VTVVGLGGAPIGRESITDEEAMETVWASLEGGVNLVDTSPHYGLGRSERRIGEALRQRPDLAEEVILSTKTGHYGDEKDYSYDRTMRSVETSLERLGVDYLPIVHIHDVVSEDELKDIVRQEAAHAALSDLREEGVVGNIGVGTKSLSALSFAVESGEFDVFMMANRYNLIDQVGEEIIVEAIERDVGVVIAGAYATGILVKGSADPRSTYFYSQATSDVRGYVAKIEGLCEKAGCSLPAAAVQFCLRNPVEGAVTVLGARTRDQAEQNVHVVEKDIPEAFWQQLETLIEDMGPVTP